jgi:predicted nucleotidyltransferase
VRTKFEQLPACLAETWQLLLKRREEIESVTLFGSRARGDHSDRSDIDIVISAPRATQRQWLDLARYFEEESDTLLCVNVVRWERATAALKRKIQQEGRVIYERRKDKSIASQSS